MTLIKGQMEINQARRNDECRGVGAVVAVASRLGVEVPPQLRAPQAPTLHLLQADVGRGRHSQHAVYND